MPNATEGNLTGKQSATIAALLASPTIAKAAEAAGVGERTIYKWLKDTTFKAAYREAQRESFKHSIAITQKYLPHAVQTLVQIMADPEAQKSARVSAATALMKFGRESIELDNVVERVEKIEGEIAERDRTGGRGSVGAGSWDNAGGAR